MSAIFALFTLLVLLLLVALAYTAVRARRAEPDRRRHLERRLSVIIAAFGIVLGLGISGEGLTRWRDAGQSDVSTGLQIALGALLAVFHGLLIYAAHHKSRWLYTFEPSEVAKRFPAERPLTDPTAVEDALRRGRKIEAIKRYREQTGAGLVEAKMRVEQLAARMNATKD